MFLYKQRGRLCLDFKKVSTQTCCPLFTLVIIQLNPMYSIHLCLPTVALYFSISFTLHSAKGSVYTFSTKGHASNLSF